MDEEEKLWQQLLQQGYSIQTAVTESRKILDKLPGSLREDGIFWDPALRGGLGDIAMRGV